MDHRPKLGMSGSSAGATTTFAAASTRHPSLHAFFAQAGGSNIYDDVIYEGQGLEIERLWLWVAKNIPGLSASHRESVMARFGGDGGQTYPPPASGEIGRLWLGVAKTVPALPASHRESVMPRFWMAAAELDRAAASAEFGGINPE